MRYVVSHSSPSSASPIGLMQFPSEAPTCPSPNIPPCPLTENKRWQMIVAAKAENAGTVTRLQKAARAAAALLPSKAAVEAVALFAMLALLVHDVWAFGWGTSNGRYMSICDTLNSCLSFRPFLAAALALWP